MGTAHSDLGCRQSPLQAQIADAWLREIEEGQRNFGQTLGGKYCPKLKEVRACTSDEIRAHIRAFNSKHVPAGPVSGLDVLTGEASRDASDDDGVQYMLDADEGESEGAPRVIVRLASGRTKEHAERAALRRWTSCLAPHVVWRPPLLLYTRLTRRMPLRLARQACLAVARSDGRVQQAATRPTLMTMTLRRG